VNKLEPSNKFDEAHVEAAAWMPDTDLPEGAHGSCAVVGNGGVNLLAHHGAAIDAHHAVFRFNDGPTDGWEDWVGSKTTYRLVRPSFTLKQAPLSSSAEGGAEACCVRIWRESSAASGDEKKLRNRKRWEVAHAAVSRGPPISRSRVVARTPMYTHAAAVWDFVPRSNPD
jgi:hypothetical protein